ncbi:hypothetical protein BJ875DRAFT_227038 [Amylocarpus encephaloides]|uniref:Uncharacterized protein n=1 Tax=Amylocarpus encephaloides TaxID=45428 RepID=A0A9P8BZM9_9HELO|nr:hypothetical protein BJ875DRAFT_227038 [Amylocarpus encephaloides]
MAALEPQLYQRIVHWICNEKYTLQHDIEKRTIESTTCSFESSHEPSLPHENTSNKPSTASLHSSKCTRQSTLRSSELSFDGCEGDILIPTATQIDSTLEVARNIWSAYLETARTLVCDVVPACCLQPSRMLGAIPPLPEDLCGKQEISGHAIWYIPCPELQIRSRNLKDNDDDEHWDPEHVSGSMKKLSLRIQKPTICGIAPGKTSSDYPNGQAVLTLCWSFVYSARLLEMQHRRLKYSKIMSPVLSPGFEQRQRDIIIYIGHSSRKLARWLSALLAPGAGWVVQGSVPPWTAYLDPGDIRFVISTHHSLDDISQEIPPSSAEAVSLILELCSLQDFGSQPTEAFLTATLLPFCANQDLKPWLPRPQFNFNTEISHSDPAHVYEYFNDLRYYMTLSLCMGPAIWSIFWEPGIQSNDASPWLSGTHQVLLPLLASGDLALLDI